MKTEQKKDHMRFLKAPEMQHIPIGEYIPNTFKINRLGSAALVTPDKKTGAILFFMSSTCKECNFEVIEAYHQQFYYKTYLFVEAEQCLIDDLKKKYPTFIIEQVELSTLYTEINIEIVPWVYAINSIGQIVSGGIFNDMGRLRVKIAPLIKVFGTGDVYNDVSKSLL